MKHITVISNARDCRIEIIHRGSDPGVWIVRRWKKFLWLKKRISSDWFIDGKQARAFANDLKRKHVSEPNDLANVAFRREERS